MCVECVDLWESSVCVDAVCCYVKCLKLLEDNLTEKLSWVKWDLRETLG